MLGKHNFIIREAAERIARELGDTLVAPVVAYVPEGGIDPPTGHMRYAGAITLPQEHFEALLEYAARGFALHGFENVILIGDSGGSQRGMAAVAEKLNAEWTASGGTSRVLYVPEYYRGNGFREWLLEQGIPEDAIGRHAGVTDTSQLWYVAPEQIRPEARARNGGFEGSGVNGDPRSPRANSARRGSSSRSKPRSGGCARCSPHVPASNAGRCLRRRLRDPVPERHLFDIPRDVAYLNCAYMSPLLHTAVEAGTAGLRRKARPWEIEVDDFFDDSEALRAAWAELLGAGPDSVAITPSAGYGLSLAASNVALGAGQTVLLAAEQFPSNVYPWTDKARRAGAGGRRGAGGGRHPVARGAALRRGRRPSGLRGRRRLQMAHGALLARLPLRRAAPRRRRARRTQLDPEGQRPRVLASCGLHRGLAGGRSPPRPRTSAAQPATMGAVRPTTWRSACPREAARRISPGCAGRSPNGRYS